MQSGSWAKQRSVVGMAEAFVIPGCRMAEQIPINPALLVWARKRAGQSREEAAQKFKRLADWEAGASAPTYSQLEQLSDTFKGIPPAGASLIGLAGAAT